MVNSKTRENWEKLILELQIGDILNGVVFKIEPYGVYVDINKHFYGIVLAPQIGKPNIKLEDYPIIGSDIKVKVIDFSDFRGEYSYISLSMKNLLSPS